jgi:hypothetical protein
MIALLEDNTCVSARSREILSERKMLGKNSIEKLTTFYSQYIFTISLIVVEIIKCCEYVSSLHVYRRPWPPEHNRN